MSIFSLIDELDRDRGNSNESSSERWNDFEFEHFYQESFFRLFYTFR